MRVWRGQRQLMSVGLVGLGDAGGSVRGRTEVH